MGIDLASQPKETGVCLIDWTRGAGRIVELEAATLTDERLLELMRDARVSKVGIDAPFGWPAPFIDAITAYRDTGSWLDLEPNELRYRATEIRTAGAVGQEPLSVAMSDLAWPAMRCARLLSRLAATDGVLDRIGRGRVAEVYPMAALRRWSVVEAGTSPTNWSYKGDKPGRAERRQSYMQLLLDRLNGAISMSAADVAKCVADDDDFDAFVCALVARAVERGLTDPVPRGHAWLAMREGWIHLPFEDSAPKLNTAPNALTASG